MDHSLPGSSVHGDSLGKNTGVGSPSLLQGIFLTQVLTWGSPALPAEIPVKPHIDGWLLILSLLNLNSAGITDWPIYPLPWFSLPNNVSLDTQNILKIVHVLYHTVPYNVTRHWHFICSAYFMWVSHSVISDACDPRTVAHQSPLSMEFSRKEFWSRWPFPSPGDLPNLEIESGSRTLQAYSLL